MERFHRKLNGVCPYCETEGGGFVSVREYRPQQQIQLHSVCNKYSLLNQKNGARYPIQNPNDLNTEPYI